MIQRSDTKVIFAKFIQLDILAEQGRLLFSLLNAFVLAGYQIKLFDNLPSDHLDKYGRLALTLRDLELTDEAPRDTSSTVYIFDKEDNTAGRFLWRKKIQIKFDVFSPYWFNEPIIMPYPVHPLHAGPDLRERLDKFRSSEKKMRIFFSGDRKGYVKNRIRYPYEKLPRLDVINTILENMGDKLFLARTPEQLNHVFADAYTNKCVIVDQDQCWIDPTDWLGSVARCDFFLCPPGFVMPMCHNSIEAMAVGSIPIISYPEWFSPHLTDMENCVVFDGKVDLLDKLEGILTMGEERIARMRAEVLRYYESHLNPASFVRKIESSQRRKLVLLMITDANVARNSSRLGRHSILIRGNAGMNTGSWVNKLRAIKERVSPA